MFLGTFVGTGGVTAVAVVAGFVAVFSDLDGSLFALVLVAWTAMLLAVVVGAVAGTAAFVADRLLPRNTILISAFAASLPAGAALAALASGNLAAAILAPLVAGSFAAVMSAVATRTWLLRRARWDAADSFAPRG